MNPQQKRALRLKFGEKCHICGYNEYPQILTLHHTYPKRFGKQPSIGRMSRYILVCPNCHMKIEKGILKGYIEVKK